MYMPRAKPWARTGGVEEQSSLEHIVVRSGVHTHGGVCALLIGGSLCAHTKNSVCTAHTWRTVCTNTQVEIVVVWTSDGADVVVSLGRGSETGCSEQLNKQINHGETFPKRG